MNSIYGQKGGGSSGGGGIQEEPNTLHGHSVITVVDWWGEGPCEGLKNGLKDVYLDDTPVQNPDGSFNHKGVTFEQRLGYPDQAPVAGLDSLATPYNVGVDVRADTPLVRTVQNLSADAVRITINIPRLTESEGNHIKGSSVDLAIDVQPSGGAWREAARENISGKSTAPYQRDYRVALEGVGPWNVRVRRLTPDATSTLVQNVFSWASYSDIVDGKFSWPNVAYCVLRIDANQFGGSLPRRSYRIGGWIMQIPSNYNPETREYSTAFWDGTFKQGWTNNPAWVAYNIATDQRVGTGMQDADKYQLYEYGKYCDELVDDGYGGKSPRFVINTVITSRQHAQEVLSQVASNFRGAFYWNGSGYRFVQDAPTPMERLFTRANVIDGFVFQSSRDTARNTVANVTFNDPDQQFIQAVETVVDSAGVRTGSWLQKDIVAFGVTNRGQAHRFGKWAIYSDQHETTRVTFKVSYADAGLRPGAVIGVSDPKRTGPRLGGRIKGYDAATRTLTVDALPDDAVTKGKNWHIAIRLPDNSMATVPCEIGAGNTVVLSRALSSAPVDAAVWGLLGERAAPEQFRVQSVAQTDTPGVFQIDALEHHPNKYDEVERGIHFDEPPTSLYPSGALAPPTGLSLISYTELSGNQPVQCMTLSWTLSTDPRAGAYLVSAKGPDDVTYRTVGETTAVSIDMKDVRAGAWAFRVCARGPLTPPSAWATLATTTGSLLLPHRPARVTAEAGNRSVTLSAFSDGAVAQEFEFWASNVALQTGEITSNAVCIAQGTSIAHNGLEPRTTYFYYIRGINSHGVSDWYPQQATTTFNFDAEMQEINARVFAEGGLADKMLKQNAADAEKHMREQLDSAIPDAVKAASVGLADSVKAAVPAQVNELMRPLRDRVDQQSAAFQQYQQYYSDDRRAQTLEISAVRAIAAGNSSGLEVERAARVSSDTALQAQVTRVDASVGAVKSSLADAISAEASERDGAITRASRDINARVDGVTSDIERRDAARATAQEAANTRIEANRAAVADANASLHEEQLTRARDDSALAGRIDSFTTDLDGIRTDYRAAVSAEASAREGAIGRVNSELKSAVAESEARTQKQLTDRASDTEAYHLELAFTQAHTAGSTAINSTEATARATADVATASRTTLLSAQLGDLRANVTETMDVKVNALSKKLEAAWTMKAEVSGGHPAIIGMQSDGAVSDINFMADNLSITDGRTREAPFYFSNGTLTLNKAVIGEGWINGAHFGEFVRSSSWNYRSETDFTGFELNARSGVLYAQGARIIGDITATSFYARSPNGAGGTEMTHKGIVIKYSDGSSAIEILGEG